MVLRLLHLSDLHIHSAPADNVHVEQQLDAVALRCPEHHLVITGDIVDDGLEAQYQEALRLLAPFVGRLSLCPGNHDYGVLGNLYSAEAAERFDALLASLDVDASYAGTNAPAMDVLVDPDDAENQVLLLGLDSSRETTDPFDFASGEVGPAQREELAALLGGEAALSMTRVVYLHHHPFIDDPFMRLVDAQDLLATLCGRADVVLFGHAHVSAHWADHEGIDHLLAAGASPMEQRAREIAIARTRDDDGARSTIDLCNVTLPVLRTYGAPRRHRQQRG